MSDAHEVPPSPTSAEETESIDNVSLLESEVWWRDRYLMLEERGYRLRPRFHPDWVPSWRTSGKRMTASEDSFLSRHSKTMDATQFKTGEKVFIKRIEKGSSEKEIATYLSSEELSKDSRNHCVPIIETFEDLIDSDVEFLVMPYLRKWVSPPFLTVEEAIDFMRQTLEAVVFLHEMNVAHRDYCSLNIMYDASKMYPLSFHPTIPNFTPDVRKRAPYISRTAAGGVRYFVTDFGISTHFADGNRGYVLGSACQDKTVPELSDYIPYEPFPVDIYTLGNLYREEVLEQYKGLDFMLPLVESMTLKRPKLRPTATDALKRIDDIIAQLPIHKTKWRLKKVGSRFIDNLFDNLASLGPVGMAYVKSLPKLFTKSR